MKKLVLFLLLFVNIVVQAQSFSGSVLQIASPSKIDGTAGSGSGANNDVNALYLNPAGLGQIVDTEILLFYKNYYKDLSLISGGAVYPVPDIGVFGFKASYFGMPADGDVIFNEICVGLSASRNLIDNLNIGLNANYLYSRLSEYKAGTMSFDLGLSYKLDIPKTLYRNILGVGVVVKNLGPGLKYNAMREPLNVETVLGLFYQFATKYSFFYDAQLLKEGIYSHLGFEYNVNKNMQLRTGWNNTESNYKMFFGFSLNFAIEDYNLGVDYTLNPLNNLGELSHNISVSIKI